MKKTREADAMTIAAGDAGRRRPRVARPVRAAVLLEVLLAMSLLILGIAAVGSQISVGMRVVQNTDVATRALMLAESKLAELDAGAVTFDPNQKLEGDFGDPYPGWAWRIEMDPSDTPNLYMITLEIFNKPGVQFRDPPPNIDEMTLVFTTHTLRATPAVIDLSRDFGLSEDELQQVAESIPIDGFDPQNIDPNALALLDDDTLMQVMPMLMKLLGSNSQLLSALPQATRDRLRQQLDNMAQQGNENAEGLRDVLDDMTNSTGGDGSLDVNGAPLTDLNAGGANAGAAPGDRGGRRGGRGGDATGARGGRGRGGGGGAPPDGATFGGGNDGVGGVGDFGPPPDSGNRGGGRRGGNGAGTGATFDGGGTDFGPPVRSGNIGTQGRRGSGFDGSRSRPGTGGGRGSTDGTFSRGSGRSSGGDSGTGHPGPARRPGGGADRGPSRGNGLNDPFRPPTEEDLYRGSGRR